MKKILHVFARMDRGGAETRTMEIYRKIDRDKFQFDFLCFGAKRIDDYSNEIESLGGKVLFLKQKFPLQIVEMIKLLKNEGPYLAVHSHISHYSAFMMIAAKIAGVSGRIVHSRTTSDDNTQGFRKLYFFLSKLVINKLANIRLACGTEAGEYLFSGRSYQVIPNAVNLEEFETIYYEKKDIKKKNGISENCKVIGHVGRLENVKNHKFLFLVYQQYLKKNPDSILLCIGEGSLKKELLESVRELGIEHNVKFLGLRKDVPILLHMFDVFVFPSLYEGVPGVIVEAQAAGIPCLISDTVTKEIDVGTNLLSYLDLAQGVDVWCNKIEEIMQTNHITKRESLQILEKKGYSIDGSVKKLEVIYANIQRGTQ